MYDLAVVCFIDLWALKMQADRNWTGIDTDPTDLKTSIITRIFHSPCEKNQGEIHWQVKRGGGGGEGGVWERTKRESLCV